MKFYNREKELARLAKIEKQAEKSAQMTFMVGRRRIGKTRLLINAYKYSICLYFFVAKKSESLLCEEFLEEVKNKLDIPIFGSITTFKELFSLLMNLSKERHFTLIIDEFQEFDSVNSSIYSDMQNIWDSNKQDSKINLIMCGSVYSMMKRIFEGSKEPLFGRATNRIHLKAFDIDTIKEILSEYSPNYSNDDLLAFYMITGGVAKYIELLVQAEAFTIDDIMDAVFEDNSLFLSEGKNVLIEEFGKDYGNYFSILSLIASGKTSRVEIESIMNIQTGGFLTRLEDEYGLISKVRPILSKPNSRTVKYFIEDNFLNFWFRFIFKYRSSIEAGNLMYIRDIVMRDYTVYSGRILEKYFTQMIKLQMKYNIIGNYWERNNQNEIDIVAINEVEKVALIAEVKRNPQKISLNELEIKASKIKTMLKGYKFIFKGYSLDDM